MIADKASTLPVVAPAWARYIAPYNWEPPATSVLICAREPGYGCWALHTVAAQLTMEHGKCGWALDAGFGD